MPKSKIIFKKRTNVGVPKNVVDETDRNKAIVSKSKKCVLRLNLHAFKNHNSVSFLFS